MNSEPKKYDPNANGKIDDGVELSQLLSEYQCKAEDLTAADKKEPMWTTAGQVDINKRTAKKDNNLYEAFTTGAGLTAFIGILGACASESGGGALKQDELEYRERMNDATQGVDKKLKAAEKRANNINKNLKEVESKTAANKDTIA